MDSITQAVLGAAVAHAGLSRTLGRRAAAWGLLWGTLPDLDILFYPWLDTVDQLSWHRGLSHSLVVCVLAAVLLGWLTHRIHGPRAPLGKSIHTIFWVWVTHVLIDCFTVYGTQVLEPFSNRRIGFDNLFIIDPLFTLPLIFGLIIALSVRESSPTRLRANLLGLVLCSIYTMWSFVGQGLADRRFNAAMKLSGIEAERRITSATPFNTLLWRSLVETPEGYWIAYHSLLRPDVAIIYRFIASGHDLLGPVSDTRSVQQLIWFSEGFYMVRLVGGQLNFSDLRFGEFEQPESGDITTFFTWRIEPGGNDTRIMQIRSPRPRGALAQLRSRLLGETRSGPETRNEITK